MNWLPTVFPQLAALAVAEQAVSLFGPKQSAACMRAADPETHLKYELTAARSAGTSLANTSILKVLPVKRIVTFDLGPIECLVSGFKALWIASACLFELNSIAISVRAFFMSLRPTCMPR